MIKRILTEPLLHFLLLGMLLLAAFEVVKQNVPEDNRIVVNQNRIKQLSSIFAKTWQRPPTQQELDGLVNDYVLEEIYYREALRMGLDKDDTVIRRRLRQKMEFLSADLASVQQATDEELTDFMQAHADKFQRQPVYSFSQVYLNPDKHADTHALAMELLSSAETTPPLGDASMLPASLDDVSASFVDSRFGQGFAGQLNGLEPGQWDGPVESGFGTHLIRIDKKSPASMPRLEELYQQVYNEWKHDQRQTLTRKMNQRLLDDYQVTIEQPGQLQEG